MPEGARALSVSNGLEQGRDAGAFEVQVERGRTLSAQFTGVDADENLTALSGGLFSQAAVGFGGATAELAELSSDLNTVLVGETLISRGSFSGVNGNPIDWSVELSLPFGGRNLFRTYRFDAREGSLGSLEFFEVTDADVDSFTNNQFLSFNRPGTDLVELVTFNADIPVGLTQAGETDPLRFTGVGARLENATYTGFAAGRSGVVSSLVNDGTQPFSRSGVIDETVLVPSTSRFIQGEVFGPEDVSTALAYRLDADADSAIITTYLSIVPDVRIEPYGRTDGVVGEPPSAVPAPGTLGGGLAMLVFAVQHRIRRRTVD